MICPLRSCSDPGHAPDQNRRHGSVSCGLPLGLNDDALGVVVGQSMRSPEHRYLTVRIHMQPHRRLASVSLAPAKLAKREVTKCGRSRLAGSCRLSPSHFTVLSCPTVRSSCTHRISRHAPVRSTTNADPSCSALIANMPL